MIVDTFAGPGGWDHALALLGHDAIGIEHDAAACATRAAAGLTTIRADVAAWPLAHMPEVDGLIASPPCQAWSKAGKRRGLDDVAHIYAHVQRCDEAGAWVPLDDHPWADDRSPLVLEPLRWALALRPRWIACEQVPDVLPFWQRLAQVLEGLGYRTWTGELNAADYGVPQTRKRAILTARRDGPACFAPPPTHAKDPGEGLFGTLEPWVSMAEALGWSPDARAGFPRRDDRGDSPDGYRERDWRPATEPAFAVTEKARSWTALNTGRDWKEGGTREDAQTIPLTEPAPAVTHQANAWWLTRPARLEERQANGAKRRVDQPAQTITEGSVRVTIPEVLVLQGFPPDYPLRGSKTKQYEQVGNAIPPPLAAAILAPLL